MSPGRRRRLPRRALVLAALFGGACAGPGPEAALEPPLRIEPAPEESYLSLGNRLLAANEPALAMRAFTRSISVEGLSAQALTGAGLAAQRQGMLGAARRHLERARDLVPDSAIAHNNLGVVLLMLEDYHGARTAFRSAVALSGGAEDEAFRRNLERAETALVALGGQGQDDPAATQSVVRLGSDAFRIVQRPESETEALAGEEAD